MYKQIIIARKDLEMTPGKLSAQVSHGSLAFLTTEIVKNSKENEINYSAELFFSKDLFKEWIEGSFTKCVLKAKNKNHLLKAKTMAEELGLKENEDFFLIYDNCRTELIPEDNGRTLTVIGFKPMKAEFIDKIGKKYQLYI